MTSGPEEGILPCSAASGKETFVRGKLESFLRERMEARHFEKLMALQNPALHRFVADSIDLCRPDSVYVCDDSDEDVRYVREQALATGEERPLKIKGHTVHFDGYYDQGRDRESTKYLVPQGVDLGGSIGMADRETGLAEIRELLKNSMKGRQMIVRFFCLGPTNSRFSISAVQLTDSFYVAHSEDLLYRRGYEQFKKIGSSNDFFRVLHSCGRLENGVSADHTKRRIYIDITDDTVYSVNTQYAGNSVGFKKLALRLAIRKADREGWLAEHMFIMGVHGPKGRTTYFCGAFPSFCGKTSTAMSPGETIIGDDLAYLKRVDGEARAVNVECGIFGIIKDVNAKDDPELWDVLTKPGEVIFSNVLVKDGVPYWEGDGREPPDSGINHSGEWYRGKKDAEGNEIPMSHPNARYTIPLKGLSNLDPRADDPEGVVVGGIIYGGRDSDTSVPVQQAFDWAHGVITIGASLESESTAATLGKVGVRNFQPMSIKDFVSIYLGKYVHNHLEFGTGLERPPIIFGVNYFLKGEDGQYLTSKKDKYVWLKWMEHRVNGELNVRRSPTGLIPDWEDLVPLFKKVLGVKYTKEQYIKQFSIRVPQNLDRIARVEEFYRSNVPDTARIVYTVLSEQRIRLERARARFGDLISPFDLPLESHRVVTRRSHK